MTFTRVITRRCCWGLMTTNREFERLILIWKGNGDDLLAGWFDLLGNMDGRLGWLG